MDKAAIDEIGAQIDALAIRQEVQRLALQEAMRQLTPAQASACAMGLQLSVARALQARGEAMKSHQDEAMASELAATLAGLARVRRHGFVTRNWANG